MFVVGMNAIGVAPEFAPIEVASATEAVVTLTEQLRADAPQHPVDQLKAAHVDNGYHVTVCGIEYWIKRCRPSSAVSAASPGQ